MRNRREERGVKKGQQRVTKVRRKMSKADSEDLKGKARGHLVHVHVLLLVQVWSQARVSHHILTGLSGVPWILHLPLSDHVTRSTNDNVTG